MSFIGFAVIVPILCLLAALLLPTRMANFHVRSIRRIVTTLVGLQLLAATALLSLQALSSIAKHPLESLNWSVASSYSLTFHQDMLSSLMLVLVSFIGWVICRYSIRYLDGDPNQGRYFRWTAFTLGAVSLLVVSGNLLLFFGAWVMTSFGLHRLLLHFPDRPAARRAAWTKFAISRFGDCFLILALALVYREFGTFQFDELFAAVPSASSSSVTAIAWCLVIGALTKSAQFPLHSWLPETMETPTPVSALMHAGIVNAGGYLVIRLSPIIAQAPQALFFLALIGLVTVCFAGIVMLTQTSIKKTLAYSTVAQMGFMMLQCGLGAFSAAMLHIIAHSLYKAHAFLSSGSVLSDAAHKTSKVVSMANEPFRFSKVLSYSIAVVASVLVVGYLFGVSLADKSGGMALGFVFLFALTAWAWDVLRISDSRAVATGLTGVIVLTTLYLSGFYFTDYLIAPDVASVSVGLSALVVSIGVVTVFLGILLFQWLLSSGKWCSWLAPLYVHASNGFYVDAAVRRIWCAVPSISIRA